MKKLAWLALAIGVFVYLATGFAVIQQDEEGVERRFGAVVPDPLPPGLHWTLPWGLGRLDRVKTGQTRSVSVGAQSLQAAPLTRTPNPETDDFLTGDLNLAPLRPSSSTGSKTPPSSSSRPPPPTVPWFSRPRPL